MKTVKIEELRSVLQMEKTRFEYKKRDGTMRKAYGTLQFTYIPEDKQPKDNSVLYENFRYFDLEKGEWRSIAKDITEVIVFDF
jgi:hypothetical protein